MRISRAGVSILLTAIAVCAALPAPAASASAVKPIASAATNWDGVTVDLMSVERKGSVLTVKWAVRNEGAEQAHVLFAYTGELATTYAVDEENGTKYFALTDKEGTSLASEHAYIGSHKYGVDEYVAPGATARFWMKLPAPPPEVKTLTVMFSETEPFEEVPVTDR